MHAPVDQSKIDKLRARVALLREEAEALADESSSFPAVRRNALRIQACVRVLEANLGS